GLTITGSDVTVRGLVIVGFGVGIHLTGTGATGNWIYGNFLGTDPTGTQAQPNFNGIVIDAGAGENLIGTNGDGIGDDAERNLLSGNAFAGISISGFDSEYNVVGAEGNIVAGNFIGTDRTGRAALGNQTAGVWLVFATSNWVGVNPYGGQAVADQGNVIAANGFYGVVIAGVYGGGESNVVAGNKIGTDVTGRESLPNQYLGVEISASSNNTVGGTVAGAGNLIAKNGWAGVAVEGDSVGNAIL